MASQTHYFTCTLAEAAYYNRIILPSSSTEARLDYDSSISAFVDFLAHVGGGNPAVGVSLPPATTTDESAAAKGWACEVLSKSAIQLTVSMLWEASDTRTMDALITPC